jgi:hypothetical protein
VAGLRDAIFWNVASAPVRLLLGLAQTAVLARSLYGTDGSDLAAFALLGSIAATITWMTSAGVPQIFSKVATRHIANQNSDALGPFVTVTAAFRTSVWLLLAVFVFALFEAHTNLFPRPLQDRVNPVVIYLWLAWGWFSEIAGLGGRLLSASYEQKWQNLIGALSQAISLFILGLAIYFPLYRMEFVVSGMAVMYGIRTLGYGVILARTGFRLRRAMSPGVEMWRAEFGQIIHTSLDKFSAYLLSAHFVLLVAGYILAPAAVASLFLIFDLSSKLVALLAVPLSGIVLPALGHASVQGQTPLRLAIQNGFAAVRVVGFAVVLFAGALAMPTAELVYGRPLEFQPALVSMIVGAMAVEFLLLELTNAYMTIEWRVKQLWIAKTAIVTIAILAAAVSQSLFKSAAIGLISFFGIRVLFMPYVLTLCGLGLQQVNRNSLLTGAVALAALVGHMFYKAGETWLWANVLLSLIITAVVAAATWRSVLLNDVNVLRQLAFPRR